MIELDRASAPIDRDLLGPVLAPIGQARTLPAQAYTSGEVLAWERRRFFDASWVCVGRSSDLGRGGEQRAVRVGEESALLVRASDGQLRAFSNVCRHRGHELLGCGEATRRHAIRCPYHAWVYALDGSLRAAPRFGHLDPDDPVHEGLVRLRVGERFGWIFVNVSGDGPDLDGQLGSLADHLEPYRPERLIVGATHEYEVAANWKLVVENYHECYHCPSIHPELCRVTPTESGVNFEPEGLWAGGSMDLEEGAETMSLDGRSGGAPIPGLQPDLLRQVFYFGLFPNFLISPHPDYVMTHRIQPLAMDRSIIECQWLFPPEAFEREGFDPSYAVEFWDLTNRQDWAACESVQRGAANRGYRQGPLALMEDAAHQFLHMVGTGYRDGRPRAPHSETMAGYGDRNGGG